VDLLARAGAALGMGRPARFGDLLGLSRRDFMKLSALGVAGLALASCTEEQLKEFEEKVKNRPVRRDINSLANDDPILVSYRAAVTAMKGLPASDRRNWQRQAEIHLNFCPHGNWLFLPWHRAYLHFFEEICRELSGNNGFALPYWNWQKDKSIPAALWGEGNPLFNSTRSATPASTVNASLFSPSNIENILDETNFELFASGAIPGGADQRTGSTQGPLESGPHNSIHNFTGGEMASFLSPLDPVFWAHHNVIDAIWVEWNVKRNNPNTNNGDWNRTFTEFCDRQGNPVEVTSLTTTLYPLFTYRFDDPVLGVP
jgi:tyrosinase